ncbi:unnamed protein product [Arctogadus glacialis]
MDLCWGFPSSAPLGKSCTMSCSSPRTAAFYPALPFRAKNKSAISLSCQLLHGPELWERAILKYTGAGG